MKPWNWGAFKRNDHMDTLTFSKGKRHQLAQVLFAAQLLIRKQRIIGGAALAL